MKCAFQKRRRSFQLRYEKKATRRGIRNGAGSFVYILALFLSLPTVLFAEYRFPVGERATYKVMWGPLACGTSTIRCDEAELDGKKMIRIRIRAKSNWLVSTIYPVDDTIDCYIDPETKLSVRLEKHTSEGGHIDKDVLVFDRTNQVAKWVSESDNITTNYPVEAGTCDAVSFLYAFRQHDLTENETRSFNLAVDSALHGITIIAKDTDMKKVGEGNKVKCRKYVVVPKRDDLFVRKIPKEIWITEDDRKIMARMDVRVPVGKARIILEEYVPPNP